MNYLEQSQKKMKQTLNRLGRSFIQKNYYKYILSDNDLVNSYFYSMADLHYPLRKEVKRDRYIVNRKALEGAIQKAVDKALKEIEEGVGQLIDFLSADLVQSLQSLEVTGSQQRANRNSFRQRFVKELSKVIVKGTIKILDNTVNDKP